MKALVFPRILIDCLKQWLRLKDPKVPNKNANPSEEEKSDEALSLRQRNLPISLIIKESVQRFQEVIGVRPETQTKSLFTRGGLEQKTIIDWTVQRPKSSLACVLLELIRHCFKDLRAPDFTADVYNTVEVLVCPLLENLDNPSMGKYKHEVLAICNEMIIVKQEVTPILSEILH